MHQPGVCFCAILCNDKNTKGNDDGGFEREYITAATADHGDDKGDYHDDTQDTETVMEQEEVNVDIMEEPPEIVVVQAVPVVTTIRQAVTPLLPPPLVRAMDQADPLLQPYVGEEESMTVLLSVILALLVWRLVVSLSSSLTGKAVVDDDEDEEVVLSKTLQRRSFTDTVLLCGPSGGGKTRWFYRLCHDESQVRTVVSLRANVGFRDGVRFMDYPGHEASLNAQVKEVLRDGKTRIVLVIDASKPLAGGADVLFQLLQETMASSSSGRNKEKLSIVVACNKSDLSNAKNWRRIKIQLRTELERLLKLSTLDANDLWWPPSKPLVLDEAANISLISTSQVDGTGCDEIHSYCFKGTVPDASSATKK